MGANKQVLLVGNGLNRAYGGVSWGELIGAIKERDDLPEKMSSPMPMQAIIATNNGIRTAMKNHKKEFWGEIRTAEQMDVLRRILFMDFDDILTTNYSYELEEASFGKETLSESQIKKLAHTTQQKVEPKYLMHSYNECNGRRIWHIHGESRKPDSMILGHYWYAGQICRMKEVVDKRGFSYRYCQEHAQEINYSSWIDSFILGNVFVLGFGFDFSEIDLWYLLNRKLREKAEKGTVYFYDMESKGLWERNELLKLMGVVPVSFGMQYPDRDDRDAGQRFREFYEMALKDISIKLSSNRVNRG